MSRKPEDLALEAVEKEVGNLAQVLGLFEHQVDLMAQLILDLASIADQTKLTSEMQERINMLRAFMQNTSVDFSNLSDPFQSYRIPAAIESKARIRRIQEKYLRLKLGG